MFSCWNGAVVIHVALVTNFTQAKGDMRGTGKVWCTTGIRRKIWVSPPPVGAGEAGDGMTVTEKASECFLVPMDLWNRGCGEVMVVPRARCVLCRFVSFRFVGHCSIHGSFHFVLSFGYLFVLSFFAVPFPPLTHTPPASCTPAMTTKKCAKTAGARPSSPRRTPRTCAASPSRHPRPCPTPPRR